MVRHFRAASDGERKHIVGVEAKVASASATPGYQVTQRDRSCAGKTTERGTETGLPTSASWSYLTWHGSVPRPISFAKAEGSGDVHGQTTGGKASRERGGVSLIGIIDVEARSPPSGLPAISPTGGESTGGTLAGLSGRRCSAIDGQLGRGWCSQPLSPPVGEMAGRPEGGELAQASWSRSRAIGWTKLVRGSSRQKAGQPRHTTTRCGQTPSPAQAGPRNRCVSDFATPSMLRTAVTTLLN